MKIHYEWWAKAGGGPGYSHELKKSEYVKDFNWLKNWTEKYFFNKVSDTLLGILAISLIVYLIFNYKKIKLNPQYSNIKFIPVYLIFLLFLLEWFFNHPALRYGGYVLFTIPIFLFTSIKISNLKIKTKNIYQCTIFLIILTFIIFNTRNVSESKKR